MAISGTIDTNSYDGRYYRLTWSAEQSTADNTSKISWTLEALGSSGSWYAERTLKVLIDGKEEYSKSARVERYTGVIASGTTEALTHDSNGYRSVTIAIQAAVFYSTVNCTASKTVSLDRILRGSTLTASNSTLGTEQTLTVKQNSTAFTHSIKYTCGSVSGYIASDGTLSSTASNYSATSIPFTPPIDLAAQNTSGQSVLVVLTIETFNGSTSIGTSSVTIQCEIPSSIKPTMSLELSDPNGYFDTYGAYIQGKSKLKGKITASGNQGSSIKSYSTSADGKTYSYASFTSDVLVGKGTLTVSSYVIDTRERTATTTQKITVLEYANPAISKMVVRRCDSDGTANSTGAYLAVIFSSSVTSLNDQNTAVYTLKYKKTTETDTSLYTTVTLEDFANQYSVSNGTYVFEADISSSYDVILTATDSFTSSVPISAVGASSAKTLSLFKKGLGLALGKVAEKAGLDVNWDAWFNKKVYVQKEDKTFLDVLEELTTLDTKTTTLNNSLQQFAIETVEHEVILDANEWCSPYSYYKSFDISEDDLATYGEPISIYATNSAAVPVPVSFGTTERITYRVVSTTANNMVKITYLKLPSTT